MAAVASLSITATLGVSCHLHRFLSIVSHQLHFRIALRPTKYSTSSQFDYFFFLRLRRLLLTSSRDASMLWRGRGATPAPMNEPLLHQAQTLGAVHPQCEPISPGTEYIRCSCQLLSQIMPPAASICHRQDQRIVEYRIQDWRDFCDNHLRWIRRSTFYAKDPRQYWRE